MSPNMKFSLNPSFSAVSPSISYPSSWDSAANAVLQEFLNASDSVCTPWALASVTE